LRFPRLRWRVRRRTHGRRECNRSPNDRSPVLLRLHGDAKTTVASTGPCRHRTDNWQRARRVLEPLRAPAASSPWKEQRWLGRFGAWTQRDVRGVAFLTSCVATFEA
jgi:hypothetical protein